MEPISTIICTRNRADSLTNTLASVLAEDPAEVVIIDQSDDGATEALVKSIGDDRLKYVFSSVAGLSKAYNTGIQNATSELLAFTDDDCVVPQGWLSQVRRAFEAHPEASMIYGQVLAGEMELAPGAYIPEFRIAHEWKVLPRGPVTVAGMGANFCARRQALIDVGGFDEALGGGGKFSSSQDFDLEYRMWRAGHPVVFTPDVVVLHYGARTRDEWPRTAHAYGIGDGAFYLKHARCRDGVAARLLVTKLAKEATTPFYRFVRRKPYSGEYASGFIRGMAKSFRHPVDRRTRRYASNV